MGRKQKHDPSPLGRIMRLGWLGMVSLRGVAGSWQCSLSMFKPAEYGGRDKLRGEGDTPTLALTRLENEVKRTSIHADPHQHN